MKSRIIVFSLFVSLIVVVALVMTASKAQPKQIQQQISELEEKDQKIGLTLKERVQLAKLKGEPKLFVPASYRTAFIPEFKDMETAAAVYSVVIAQPVAAKSIFHEGFIGTLYKFKTLEILSEPPPSKFPYTFNGTPPAELQPFDEGEFLVSIRGGSVTIDGVEVTTKYDGYELFSMSKKYLLFLEFDITRKVGGMSMGPLSALTINDDGTLETLDKQPHKIKQAINRSFGNSVEQLKIHLKKRRKS